MSTIELQSQDHRELLDIIDKLRSLGVTRYIDLPQIIVCGDQSSGKSSVLEAVSGLSFPTKDTLCTRFATELVLRRDETPRVHVAIIPGVDRTQEEIGNLSKFGHEINVLKPDLSKVVEEAKKAMGLSEVKLFSDDILRVELQGPDQPHLTLVDLPGLFRASNRDQSVDSAPIVQKMVRSYMEQPRSIILAVVSAQSDFNLQPITELSRQLDPSGSRTLGLITKPDTLPKGSDSEASYFALAQNKDVVFQLGWHVLRNRSFETRNSSSAERDSDEKDFFSKGVWARLDRNTVGVDTLRPRLSGVLTNLILRQLPSLLRDASTGIAECQQRLKCLGESRGTPTKQRRYLRQVSWSFSLLMRAAVDGFYTDEFFEQASTDKGYQKRIRAVVQNELESFAEVIRFRGRAQIILNDGEEYDSGDSSIPSIAMSDYLVDVSDLMQRSRGCELPGTFNPLIVGELFRNQSRPWEKIVANTQASIVQAVRKTTYLILDSIAVPETVNAMSVRMNRMIDNLAKDLKTKTYEVLRPHSNRHPITYNHYLTDTVQKVQSDRTRRTGVHVNMNTYASQLAADYMQAYYKVAVKRFIDDVSVLAVEEQLMQQLPLLFDSDTVDSLTDDEVASLAAESEATADVRLRHREKLVLLEQTIQELQRFQTYDIELLGELVHDTSGDSICTDIETSDISPRVTWEDADELHEDASQNSSEHESSIPASPRLVIAAVESRPAASPDEWDSTSS
nr:interferon-induced gtp-binding protein mx3 [Quercus suber]